MSPTSLGTHHTDLHVVFDNFLALNGNRFQQDWKHKTLFFQQQANAVFLAKSKKKKTQKLSTPLSTPSCARKVRLKLINAQSLRGARLSARTANT